MFWGKGSQTYGTWHCRRCLMRLLYTRWKNTRHPRGFPSISLFCLFSLSFFSTSCGYWREAKGTLGDWQHSRSKSINRHVSHNSAITFHCSPLEHVEDMSSWCQIPSIAPDGCDAIDLAELGRLRAIITTRDLNLNRENES